ncbi:MAG: ASKHA domain-containing protein, partial [Candidatus Subteraquimicrobiales bacterium]|nr:ASKHA domain-containing protein [Candidatus Subteraquimicrobiales bacterium]
MGVKKLKVVFLPYNKEVFVDEGENLLRAAMLAEVHVNASCGGDGTCGKCRVIVEQGRVKTRPSLKLLKEDIDKGYVLACQALVKSDLQVRIPPESILGEKRILDRKRMVSTCGAFLSAADARDLVKKWKLSPATRRLFLELSPPTLEDSLSDLDRLRRGLSQSYGMRDFPISFPVLKELARNLREKDWKVTATLLSHKGREKLTQVLSGDRSNINFGVIVDIGTTTVYAQLLNLINGELIAEASDYNAQVSCGEDVISRIVYSLKGEGLNHLKQLVVSTINGLIAELLKKSSCDVSDITHIVVAGNTTMTHLFLGLSPRYIREEPYVPTVSFVPRIRGKEIGLEVDGGVYVYALPCRVSYVGGDIVSGILGSGMFKSDKLTLFIDVGTNGELVLGNSEWLLACSCSAGPAFEGGTIKHGMRATTGAIESVRISRDTFEPMILTIGQTKPKGICGSGLIDAVAELFLSEVIDQKGKF